MKKHLLLKILTVLSFIFANSFGFAQQLSLNGDVNSAFKGSPNGIMAYTPCPAMFGIDSTKNAVYCNSLTLGSSVMTAMGGVSPYNYAWFKTIGYAPLTLPAITSTYTAMQARGFWFTSPTTTVITGLHVPTDIGTANQFIYVVKWSTVPPTYPTLGSNYTVLGKFLDVPGLDTVKCGIKINIGDIIGILGVRGSTAVSTASMSYGTGGFATTISGNPVTLYRFMDQTDITTNPLGQLTEGGSGSLARVDVFFGSSISLFSSANNLTGGNYVCFYADTNGCTRSSTVSVVPAATMTLANSFINPSCVVGNDGSATVTPIGGYVPYTYSWSPIGGTSSTANGLSVGSYTCLVTDTFGNCKSTIVTLGTCTGLNELHSNSSLSIYPNPAAGKFNIQSAIKTDIEIFNALGSVVYIGKIDIGSNSISLTDQADGIYYLQLKENSGQAYFKIIKN